MQRAVNSICAGLLCICLTFVLLAQPPAKTTATVPRLVQFSGALTAANSQPLSGLVGVTFSLYEEERGGAPLWMESQNVQADANGRYTAMLGATRNDGVPAEVLASEQGRWLGVQPQGEAEQPRVLLVSVPYALKAADADTLAGKPASAYLLAGSPTSVQPAGVSGVAQPAQPLADVSVKAGAHAKPAVTSTGTTNYIPEFTDTSGDIGDSVMYQNGSNIGVGTNAGAISMDIRPTATSPYAQLGVAQTVDYMTLFASDKYGPAFYWDPAKALRLGIGGTGLYNEYGFVEYMRIQPNGYVGIGTQTPGTTLEVNGNAQVDGSLTLGVNVISKGAGVPLIQAPTNSTNNLAVGLDALSPATTGNGDTAIGDWALQFNTTGLQNTANGSFALNANTVGGDNTALGYGSLFKNSSGNDNTAVGNSALYNNTGTEGAGSDNSAVGSLAMVSNVTGSGNTAEGYQALYVSTSGSNNTAIGTLALASALGSQNTAVGYVALGGLNDFSINNVAVGNLAGDNLTSGNGNIYIGNQGNPAGVESGNIYIGTQPFTGCTYCQASAYIAGIAGTNVSGSEVVVSSTGQLGTVSSSRRYKEDIQDMGDASNGLIRLRPVTFRYKKPYGDGSQPIQYGLIAEEVAEVYPDLVVRSADGQIETVKYQLLVPMLLNELQKQNATIAAQKEQIGAQSGEIQTEKEQFRLLAERLAKVEAALEGSTMSAPPRQ
jgi:hypothetical protein